MNKPTPPVVSPVEREDNVPFIPYTNKLKDKLDEELSSNIKIPPRDDSSSVVPVQIKSEPFVNNIDDDDEEKEEKEDDTRTLIDEPFDSQMMGEMLVEILIVELVLVIDYAFIYLQKKYFNFF